MIRASDIMETNLICINPETEITRAVEILLNNHINGVPVVDSHDELIGILCQSDLIFQQKNMPVPPIFTILDGLIPLSSSKKLGEAFQKISATQVKDAMVNPVTTVSPDTPVSEIASLMVEKHYHTIPVVEGKKIVGIIGKEDLLKIMTGNAPLREVEMSPNSSPLPDREPTFSIPNIRRYIAFKVLFNSRFYYPVFTILFLDFGLTVAQFSILNAVWAATIVLAEVPSGALADTIGRKRLLVFATMTMVVEVGLIAFLPTGNMSLVFWVFLANRVLSGLAEAAASGADEALAYDALKKYGDPRTWGQVLEVLTRFQSVGFIIAMTTGAAIYDPSLMSTLAEAMGISLSFTRETCMRFPLYGTLFLALGACVATVGMEDIGTEAAASSAHASSRVSELGKALGLTLRAGAWILSTPFVLGVILFGMLFDSSIRMVITLSSQYYRMILLPESLFGIIGAGVAVLGFFIPGIARRLAENRPPQSGLWLTAGLTAAGLISMRFFLPWIGMIPALITYSAMYFNGFFVSFYINRETPSAQRATVLSFKGLSYNLAYGLYGTGYALILKLQRQALDTDLTGQVLDNLVFRKSFFVFPSLFLAGFISLILISALYLKPHRQTPDD